MAGFQRGALLGFCLPASFVSYFGLIALAGKMAGFHEWRVATISRLLYPPRDPKGCGIALLGVILGSLLVLPFPGYIARRLRGTWPNVARAGLVLFGGGAVGGVLTGLLGYREDFRFPSLHTRLAQISALALGLGSLAFWACALAEILRSSGRRRLPPALAFGPPLLLLGGAVFGALSACAKGTHLLAEQGLWEWVASGFLYGFLLLFAALLPKDEG